MLQGREDGLSATKSPSFNPLKFTNSKLIYSPAKKHLIKFTNSPAKTISSNSQTSIKHQSSIINCAYLSLRPILFLFYCVFHFISYSSYLQLLHLSSSFILNSRHRSRSTSAQVLYKIRNCFLR